MAAMIKGKATIVRDKDMGYQRMVENLGGLGAITLGVQGPDAAMPHPSAHGQTVGEIAAIHELGLGVPQRSWLRKWMDNNSVRMGSEAKAELIRIAEGKTTRKQGFERLGYKWVQELQDNIYAGRITPPLSILGYRNRTGLPLWDTGLLASKISYVVHLERNLRRKGKFVSERGAAQDALGGAGAFAKNMPGITAGFPSTGSASPPGTSPVTGSPQPPARPVRGGRIGPLRPASQGGGFGRPRQQGPKLPGGGFRSKRGRQIGPRLPQHLGGGFRIKRFGPRKPKGFLKFRVGSSVSVRRPKANSLLKWLIRKAMRMLRKGKGSDFRNHGFTKSGKGGRTGRAGFKK